MAKPIIGKSTVAVRNVNMIIVAPRSRLLETGISVISDRESEISIPAVSGALPGLLLIPISNGGLGNPAKSPPRPTRVILET
jgi:hypothetical protein